MKSLTIITLITLTSLGAFAQTYIAQIKSEENKKWGYINQKGETVIAPVYKTCYEFGENGLAPIYEAKEFSFINTKGQPIHTEISGFKMIEGFLGFGGLEGFHDGLVAVMKDKKWGYLNEEGKIAIDLKYDDASSFDGGFATAEIGDKFYVLNKAGDEKLIDNASIKKLKHFSEGLAPFENDNKELGFINTSGEIAIPAKFSSVGYFTDGLAWAKTSDKTIGFIDKTGAWVINPQFEAAKDFDPVSGLARVKLDGNWAYVNKEGKIIRIDDTESWGSFNEGLAKGKKDGKTGYYNSKGEWVIPPQFDSCRDYKNGFIAVEKDGKWGFIDKTGKWVIEPKYLAVKDMEKVNE